MAAGAVEGGVSRAECRAPGSERGTRPALAPDTVGTTGATRAAGGGVCLADPLETTFTAGSTATAATATAGTTIREAPTGCVPKSEVTGLLLRSSLSDNPSGSSKGLSGSVSASGSITILRGLPRGRFTVKKKMTERHMEDWSESVWSLAEHKRLRTEVWRCWWPRAWSPERLVSFGD